MVTEATGMVGKDHLFSLAQAVEQRDSAAALEQIDHLYSGSKDMARLCEELSSHYRSLMLIKTMRDARNILAVSEEEYTRLTQQALRSPLPVILHALNLLQEALEHMSRGADRRIEMEMTLLKLCAPELDSSMDAVIRRIEALERGADPGCYAGCTIYTGSRGKIGFSCRTARSKSGGKSSFSAGNPACCSLCANICGFSFCGFPAGNCTGRKGRSGPRKLLLQSPPLPLSSWPTLADLRNGRRFCKF